MAEDAYVRWQGIRITQLGRCVNLFLTYAVAALGFSLHLLSEPRFPSRNSPAKALLLMALIFGLLSIFFGAWACLNRLFDFRLTAQIVRLRERENEKVALANLRRRDRVLERRTWRLLWLEIVTFGLQLYAVVLFLTVMYWGTLVGVL